MIKNILVPIDYSQASLNAFETAISLAAVNMLIPEGKKWHEFNKILFPVRPSLFSCKLYQVVDNIIKQNKNACKVQILGISTDRYAKDMPQLFLMARKLKDKNSGSKIDIMFSASKNINISESVLSRANESKADLIIISPGVDVPSKPFFVGPFSQRIINHANIPVLSILKTSEN